MTLHRAFRICSASRRLAAGLAVAAAVGGVCVSSVSAAAEKAAADKKAPAGEADGKSVEALAKEGYWGDPPQWEKHSKLLGQPAPKLDLSEWVGDKKVAEKDMKGRIVVVDFWATWCGPCIRAIPHNNEVAKKYADRGVLLVGACGGGGEERMAAVAKDKNIEYPTAKVTKASTEAWQVGWWPTYTVIDRKGNVRAFGIKPDYVDKVVEALLKEQPPEAGKSAGAN